MNMSAVMPQLHSSVTRTVVRPDEALSLGLRGQTLEVVAGCAWISWNGEDILLSAGARLTFGASFDHAVISAMRRSPVIFDIKPTT